MFHFPLFELSKVNPALTAVISIGVSYIRQRDDDGNVSRIKNLDINKPFKINFTPLLIVTTLKKEYLELLSLEIMKYTAIEVILESK